MFCRGKAEYPHEPVRRRVDIDVAQGVDGLAEFNEIAMDSADNRNAVPRHALRFDVQKSPVPTVLILKNEATRDADVIHPQQAMLERIEVELRQFIEPRLDDLNPCRLRWP